MQMDTKTFATLVVTIFLAVVGYTATYMTTLRLAKRKERLERVDRQLREYYGPLYALTESASKSWSAFRIQINRPTGSFWHTDPAPSDREKSAWRLWMQHVLMPLNLRIEMVIVEHTDLLEGPEMPACILELLAHIAAYKAVLKGWESGDYTTHISVVDYPGEVNHYAKCEYLKLKAQQQSLIGSSAARDYTPQVTP
jgi:hypothetical protein